MQTNVVSMAVVMQVWEAIDHIYLSVGGPITRPKVLDLLEGKVCRTSIFYAFDVLQKADVVYEIPNRMGRRNRAGRPPMMFWSGSPFHWPDYNIVEERITEHYERMGYARS